MRLNTPQKNPGEYGSSIVQDLGIRCDVLPICNCWIGAYAFGERLLTLPIQTRVGEERNVEEWVILPVRPLAGKGWATALRTNQRQVLVRQPFRYPAGEHHIAR